MEVRLGAMANLETGVRTQAGLIIVVVILVIQPEAVRLIQVHHDPVISDMET